MAIERDDSEYGGQTVAGPAWVNVDEDLLAEAKDQFRALERDLRNSVVPSTGRQMMRLSDSWDGAGSEAAVGEASAIGDEHEANVDVAKETARKLEQMEGAVARTKNRVNFVAKFVQVLCEEIKKESVPENAEDTRERRIADLIEKGYKENLDIVSSNTRKLAGTLGIPSETPGANGEMPTLPSEDTGSDSSEQRLGDTLSGFDALMNPTITPPTDSNGPRESKQSVRDTLSEFGAVEPSPALPPQGDAEVPGLGGQPLADTTDRFHGSPPAVTPPKPGPAGHIPPVRAPAPSPTGVVPEVPSSVSGGGSGPVGSPGSSLTAASSSAATSGTSISPRTSSSTFDPSTAQAAEAAQAGAGNPAATPPPPTPLDAAVRAASAAQVPMAAPIQPLEAPAAAQPPPASPAAAAAPAPPNTPPTGGAAGPVGSGGAAPAAPMPGAGGGTGGGPMPLGPAPTPPPAAPVPPAAPAPGPVAPPAAATGASGVAAAPVPVTATRAQRDAVAGAATAGALRRLQGGNDPLRLARQIAAALNAPPSIPEVQWGFLWATGVTVDGTIVVANSYGLAYIPDGVNLPEQVKMATADESILAAERAKWVSYPFLALQGWAQHSGTRLQAVIGTDEQLQGLDPGARKVVVDEADIPQNGTMQGRSRLEVIAPEPAARLAAMSEANLPDLLPPPVDATVPEDRSSTLWFDMIKPLMRSGKGREADHLTALVAYADHRQELALHRAHTAAEPHILRDAIADWVYWQHLSVLTTDALTEFATT